MKYGFHNDNDIIQWSVYVDYKTMVISGKNFCIKQLHISLSYTFVFAFAIKLLARARISPIW